MLSRKLFYIFEFAVIILLLIIASSIAIYTNYNSDNNNGFTPLNSIDAENQYQIDAEAADSLWNANLIQHSSFQLWGVAGPWPYQRIPNNAPMNGIRICPNGQASWNLSGLFDAIPDLYPEFRWGIYRVHLVFVTTDEQLSYGPNAPTDIAVWVDGGYQFYGTIWSADPTTPYQSVYNDIWVDFHLNYGQGSAPTWLGQQWNFNQPHFLRIRNNGPNYLYLDEIHLSVA